MLLRGNELFSVWMRILIELPFISQEPIIIKSARVCTVTSGYPSWYDFRCYQDIEIQQPPIMDSLVRNSRLSHCLHDTQWWMAVCIFMCAQPCVYHDNVRFTPSHYHPPPASSAHTCLKLYAALLRGTLGPVNVVSTRGWRKCWLFNRVIGIFDT